MTFLFAIYLFLTVHLRINVGDTLRRQRPWSIGGRRKSSFWRFWKVQRWGKGETNIDSPEKRVQLAL